jgi:hypothetical protein
VSDQLSTWGVWSSQAAALELSTPTWMASGGCAPATCQSLGQECGQPSDGCGGSLNCGGCGSSQACASGGVCVDVTPPTPGSWPSPSDPLGHRHPECLAIYGKTPAQIEATPCNVTGAGDPTAGETYTGCYHNGTLDFQGDNITFDCVKWDTGATGFGTRCQGTPCDNIVFRRSTITGNNGVAPAQNLILMTSRGGQPLRSVLIEKCDISESDVAILCGSAANGSTNPLPGEGDKALVIRDSRLHGTTHVPGAHTDIVFLAEGCRGVLLERNLLDGSDVTPGRNVGSVLQDQPLNSNGGNHVFRNNRFVHDGSGRMFNFDRAPGTTADACAAPVIFESNVFDWSYDKSDGFGDTLFSVSTTGRECSRIESRPGSRCTSNTFADGSAAKCSGDGS